MILWRVKNFRNQDAQNRIDLGGRGDIKFRNEHVLSEEIDSLENSVRIFFSSLKRRWSRIQKFSPTCNPSKRRCHRSSVTFSGANALEKGDAGSVLGTKGAGKSFSSRCRGRLSYLLRFKTTFNVNHSDFQVSPPICDFSSVARYDLASWGHHLHLKWYPRSAAKIHLLPDSSRQPERCLKF